jgi:hypothetical protein
MTSSLLRSIGKTFPENEREVVESATRRRSATLLFVVVVAVESTYMPKLNGAAKKENKKLHFILWFEEESGRSATFYGGCIFCTLCSGLQDAKIS